MLIWNNHAAEAASTRIKNIGTNSFDIESAAPTDTYDYLVLSDNDQIDLGTYLGNGSTDGPYVDTGHRAQMVAIKDTGTQGDFGMWTSGANPYNPALEIMWFEEPDEEKTGNAIDILSRGFKLRNAGNDDNGSGLKYTYISFAEALSIDVDGRILTAR